MSIPAIGIHNVDRALHALPRYYEDLLAIGRPIWLPFFFWQVLYIGRRIGPNFGDGVNFERAGQAYRILTVRVGAVKLRLIVFLADVNDPLAVRRPDRTIFIEIVLNERFDAEVIGDIYDVNLAFAIALCDEG